MPLNVKKNWDQMIVRYLKNNPNLRMLVSLLDARRIPTDLDRQLMEWLLCYRVPFFFVVTKSDKLSRSALIKQMKIIRQTLSPPEETRFIPFSAKTRQGRMEILSALDKALPGNHDPEQSPGENG